MELQKEMLTSMAMIRTRSALIVLTPTPGPPGISQLPSMLHTKKKVRRRSTHSMNFKAGPSIRGEVW